MDFSLWIVLWIIGSAILFAILLMMKKQKDVEREEERKRREEERKRQEEERKRQEEEKRKIREKENKRWAAKRKKRRKALVKKYGEDIALKIINKQLFIDMTKEMLIDALGSPSDEKETVTREKTTNKYYYHPRKTRQSTTVYGLEVTLENDVVSGWKDLE